jgi:hypothetical protein
MKKKIEAKKTGWTTVRDRRWKKLCFNIPANADAFVARRLAKVGRHHVADMCGIA